MTERHENERLEVAAAEHVAHMSGETAGPSRPRSGGGGGGRQRR
ncbi:hypothetical protein ABZ860_39640 [Microbispora sp. NPDC046973]